MATGKEVRWVALALMVLGSIWSWIGPAPAWCGETFRDPAPQDGWLFRDGRVEVGVQAGGGVALQHAPRSGTVLGLLPRLGYVVYEVEHGLRGSLELLAQPTYLAVFQQGDTAHVLGVAGVLKYNFRTDTRLTPFAEIGAGVSYASLRVPRSGSHFNFILEAGVGLQYALSDRYAVSFEWLFNHLSNADIYPSNPGLNSGLFLLGFSVFY